MPHTPVLYVLNGPNLNLLGTREPDVYGRDTLADVEALCRTAAEGAEVVFRQSSEEGRLIDWLHEAGEKADAVVFNPAAYSHTSIALHDAIKALAIPVVECHLSNVAAREAFRHHSYVSPVAAGVVSGVGPFSYDLAVRAALRLARARAARS
ncbi:MAG: type II 3-dehydroquinate dehydratase [Brevundimonas sp.]|uniref:type II 3-dehydroquinate dehydratase n=1 Tax=Brevundimonas sp. TaxID=1871086 RepID=UPI00391B0116